MKKAIILVLIFVFPIIVLAYKPGDTYIKGDANNDGKVTSTDYIVVRKHILKQTTLSGDAFTRSDVANDNKINSSDYIAIRKMILDGKINEKVVVTGATPESKEQVTITFIGGDVVNTSYSGNEVLIKGGKVSVHKSNNLKLEKNSKYVVSFDYVTKSGSNKFNVDLYPDTLPGKTLTAKTTKNHYDWTVSSDHDDMSDCVLRFFDDQRSNNEKDVTINNVVMSKVTSKKYDKNEKISKLPTPTRKGYRFIGWYTASVDGEKVTNDTVITKDMNLYAHWGGYYKHVFIIGIDGLGDTFRPDKQKTEPNNNVDAKNFRKIFGDYAYRYDALTESITISAQNWSSIFMGVTCQTHGITNTVAKLNQRNSQSEYRTIFYYIKQAKPKAKLASIVNWDPINYGIIENDLKVYKKTPGNDTKVTNAVVDYINSNSKSEPVLMFVHLCDVDHAAHATSGTCATCGGYSTKYYNQAQKADTQLGKIYNAIEKQGLMDDSLFIVVADHGESKTSHGTPKGKNRDPEEEHVVVAVRGYTVNKMTLPAGTHNRDVSAIVLYALGIDKPEHFISNVPAGLFNK